MSIKDDILSEVNKADNKRQKSKDGIKPLRENKSQSDSVEALLIMSKLDKLFYNRDELDEERAGLHASSVIAGEADFCFREQVLSLLFKRNQGEQIPVGLKRVFAAGESIHAKWQNMFVKAGIAYVIEGRSFNEQYELYFTPDAIITLDGKRYVVEIKSMNTYSYQKAHSHPSGEKQMQLYMHLYGIPQGFVLAEDKNSQDWKPFIREYDPEIVKPFLYRLQEIQEMKRNYIKYKELPPCQCKNANTKKALQCGMRDACFKIGIGRVRLK